MGKHNKEIIAIGLIILVIILPLFFGTTTTGRRIWNDRIFKVRKVDDVTNYDTIKKVEDTCRAMIASYTTDKLTYEQYKDNDNEEKQGWAEQAKMRANKTASTYNNYILENSFLWQDNVPADIKTELEYIQ